MKDKHLFAMMIPTCLVLAFFFIFMAVTATKGPVSLTNDEVAFYENAAVSYLNKESTPHSSNANETIRYIQGKDKVTVMSQNIFKETVTVSLDNGNFLTKVNAPNVNFTGCIIFHSVLATIAIGGAIAFLWGATDELRSRKQKAR